MDMIPSTPSTALANGPEDAMSAGTEAREAPPHCRSHRAKNTGFTFLVKSDDPRLPVRRPPRALPCWGEFLRTLAQRSSTAQAKQAYEIALGAVSTPCKK